MIESYPMQMNTFQPQQPYQPRYQMPNRVNSGIIWVQGIEGAKAYQLPANSNVLLLDSENDRFYIKSTDNIGMATFRTFEFTEVTNVDSQADMSNYVTHDELEQIIADITTKKSGGKSNVKQSISADES